MGNEDELDEIIIHFMFSFSQRQKISSVKNIKATDAFKAALQAYVAKAERRARDLAFSEIEAIIADRTYDDIECRNKIEKYISVNLAYHIPEDPEVAK